MRDHHLDVTGAAGDGETDVLRMAVESQLDARIADREVADFDSFEKWRKHRIDETEAAAGRIDLQP